jgi:rubrerythrin
MERKILISRLRQLLAADKNALDIYTDLSESAPDKSYREKFQKIAQDEKNHTILDAKMLAILEE